MCFRDACEKSYRFLRVKFFLFYFELNFGFDENDIYAFVIYLQGA